MFLRRQRLAIGFLISLLIAVSIAVVAYRNTKALREASRWVEQTREVITVLEQTQALVAASETAQRAFIITAGDDYRRESLAVRPAIRANLERLEAMSASNPAQLRRLATLRQAVEAKLTYIDRQMELRETEGFDAARVITATGVGAARMRAVARSIGAMKTEEARLLAARRETSEKQAQRTLATVLVGTLVNIGLVAVIFVLVRRDQKKSRALYRALAEARDTALQSAEFRSQFLANMSHEIRTPMNAVVGMTGLLLNTKLDDNQRDLANTVRASADTLLTLINDVLDISKIDSGKLQIQPTDFELRHAVEGVVELFSEAAHAKGLDIGVLFDHELPGIVHGDPGRVRQVLTNFVSNAVKFTRRGEVVVQVSRERDEDGVVLVRFAVTDTGIGMSEDVAGRLFQPFMQGDASTTRLYGGTGLGLAISKQLVELMGGTIGVDSDPAKGSTFWFTIPLAPANGHMEVEHLESKLAGARVLIVDGSETGRRLIRHNLDVWRMATAEASSGEEAIHTLHEAAEEGRPFDLAVIDVALPDSTAVVLAKFIKADRVINPVKLVAVSSLSNPLKDDVMSGAGIEECVTKPVRQSTLYDALVRALSGERKRASRVSQAVVESQPMRQNMRVLVAEDNAVNQKLAVRQLERLGLHADPAGNGLEALEALSRIPYDLVLMDCQMPQMDGFEAAREIRRREGSMRHTPIIALTANALTGDRERCIEAGMDDYLSKPVRQDDLAAIVDKWLPERAGDALDPTVVANLKALGSGSDEFLREVFTLFRDDIPPRIRVLREALDQHNPAALASSAHAIKSSAGNVGALSVRQIAEDLETMGRARTIDGAAAMVEKLAVEITRVFERMGEMTGETSK